MKMMIIGTVIYKMEYNQGDIVLVKFPFTDLSGFKVRPAIIISNHHVHKSGDFILAMITTQKIDGIFCVEISNTDVTIPFKPRKGNLDKMYVYCKKIVTLEKSILHKRITQIKNVGKFTQIIDSINHGIKSDF